MIKRIISLGLASLLTGCATPLIPTKDYKVGDLKIVCVDERNMFKTLETNINKNYDPLAPWCSAYYDQRNKTVYVPYTRNKNKKGDYLPNFEMLGHEIWHDVAGWFHGGNPPRIENK